MRIESMPRTTLYLVRHAATEANLAYPPRLQGRGTNPKLAPAGVIQAEATRLYLADRPIKHAYCSPLQRAAQTAEIICEPHGIKPYRLEQFTECDVGRWEGMDWQTIRYLDAANYKLFMANPGMNGYPGGESFIDVYNRVAPKFDELLRAHRGESILVVAHHVVNRIYLASLMGLPPEQARQISLDNCGVSVVVCEGDCVSVDTLNATYHLARLDAA